MSNSRFVLSPAFCLHNGVAVLEEGNFSVTFAVSEDSTLQLRSRLRKVFTQYVSLAEPETALCTKSLRKQAAVFFKVLPPAELAREIGRQIAGGSLAGPCAADDSSAREAAVCESAAVALLDTLLEQARSCGATDIHLESGSVRFRTGGNLRRELELESGRLRELVLRIKLLAGLNVLETRRAQDGQFMYTGGSASERRLPVSIRVSCMPVVSAGEECESVVLRLLDPSRVPLEISTLGFTAEQQVLLKSLCSLKDGLVLLCGATGSSKSTTAAALLAHIVQSGAGRKIISLEDPPEYVIPGVTQVHVQNTGGFSFNAALRRVFRQDPDVILIGEIRDTETARAAVQAALTGHLVFATLHTSGAEQSLFRLQSLEAEPALIRTVVRGVVVQNLTYHPQAALSAQIAAGTEMNNLLASWSASL